MKFESELSLEKRSQESSVRRAIAPQPSKSLSGMERTANSSTATIQDMSINHRRLHVFMSQ